MAKMTMKQFDKTKAGKADDKKDKKKGIKENSPKDKKIDASIMRKMKK